MNDLYPDDQTIFWPTCDSANQAGDTCCWYCDADLRESRICPYCRHAIPAQEDPCHICGRLEPAFEPPEKRLEEIRKKFFWATIGFILELFS